MKHYFASIYFATDSVPPEELERALSALVGLPKFIVEDVHVEPVQADDVPQTPLEGLT